MKEFILANLTAIAFCAAAVAETAHEEGDPWCDDLEFGEAGAVSCALPYGEDQVIFFAYEGDKFEATLIVTQHNVSGGLLDTSDPIYVSGVQGPPETRDINEDGVAELFIPLTTGNVNTEFAIWEIDSDGIYAPRGTFSDGAYAAEALTIEDGLLVTSARENAAVYSETAHLLTSHGLTVIYSMTVDYSTKSCAFSSTDGIVARGLDENALMAKCLNRQWE
ncbi:MAG: hypothetical protein AAF393_01820 [Pseudomonadota bacterium]